METPLVSTTSLWITTRQRRFTFVRLSDSYLHEVRPHRFDTNAHHHGSLPQRLGVVWSLLLEADSEGPAFISEAVCRRQALISWVTRRTRRRERIEMKAISMKATRYPRSKIVFNRR